MQSTEGDNNTPIEVDYQVRRPGRSEFSGSTVTQYRRPQVTSHTKIDCMLALLSKLLNE